MQIFGVDFTSAPRKSKPITCAVCRLEGDLLALECIEELTSLDAFEKWLYQAGPWIAGMDFPFSQPRKLIKNQCKRVFDLVKDFGTSKSPKSTRPSTTY
ncbi:hypothetical protein [Solemya velesiana gill symbiont]|uniref:DUF429 domain-containing protein n=1 Tax=Solemya velesiana gill symbiont TaxID=1918948 RepID=A0A1T2KNF0_9GAMM|nr:hypothetical protein [Solemya velesiana gill symbiont]OOZ34404.1 hypothetical protein BOW51_12140 [Solemya velesiana gill symbiont]